MLIKVGLDENNVYVWVETQCRRCCGWISFCSVFLSWKMFLLCDLSRSSNLPDVLLTSFSVCLFTKSSFLFLSGHMLHLQGDLVSDSPTATSVMILMVLVSIICIDNSPPPPPYVCFPARLRGRSGSVWRPRGKNKRISFSSWRRSWMIWNASPIRRAATTRCRSLSSWRGRRCTHLWQNLSINQFSYYFSSNLC